MTAVHLKTEGEYKPDNTGGTMATNMQAQPFFDRQKSGYVRDFRTFDVFIFNVLGFSLGLALSTNPPFIGAFAPSANIVIVILLGAVLAFFNGLTYGWFGGIMPSTGGDFVFVSRSLNHRLGFITNWGFTACQIYGLALNTGFIMSVGIASSLISLGVSLGSSQLIALGSLLSDRTAVAVGSVVLLGIYYLLSCVDIRMKRGLIYAVFVVALAGPLLMGLTLYLNSGVEFISDFNAFMQKFNGKADAYGSAISIAQREGIVVDSEKMWSASLQAMPLGFLCFLGFTYSVYIGGEVLEPKRSQIRGILAALIVGVTTFVVCMGRYVTVVGQEFSSAVGFPIVIEEIGLPSNSMNFFVGAMIEHPIVNVIMQIGNLLWFLLIPYVMMQVCTHNVIAWVGDRLMPQKLNDRLESTNAPWLATLTVCLAAVVCVIAVYFFNFSLVGAIALAAVAYFLTGLGALTLPVVNRDAFSIAPGLAKVRFLGLSFFQIVGLLSAVGFAWIIYTAVTYPAISGGTTTYAIVLLGIVYISGLVVYEVAKAKLKRMEGETGIDLDSLFREIPQD